MISIIVAIAKNRAIGKDNKLLWHLPDDLKRFKKLTEGHVIIMGQKTYESLPKKPLPNRTNIVITDDKNYHPEGVLIAHSIDDAIKNSFYLESGYINYGYIGHIDHEIFVIGGASIYKQFLPLADKLYITQIDKEFEGDVFFPELSKSWRLIEDIKTEGEEFDYSYQIWSK